MQSLPEVETARALMNEAYQWSVMRWLREKKRVRKAADVANAAVDAMSRRIKQQWPAELRDAYSRAGDASGRAGSGDRELARIAGRVRQADEAAKRARDDAEETFDKAERILSTSLAREGCQKAILEWDLHEKAIREAEEARDAAQRRAGAS